MRPYREPKPTENGEGKNIKEWVTNKALRYRFLLLLSHFVNRFVPFQRTSEWPRYQNPKLSVTREQISCFTKNLPCNDIETTNAYSFMILDEIDVPINNPGPKYPRFNLYLG
ncbi:hypothetical protein Y032_0018g3633 [Ancylostoma ceylanicum]|uniref:PiggyBac transposable element-derived protein domain-containing protein n=1 Tax=Ancylostoma ceylanicum TaxID=53326 RepID=A0A016V4N1_9BILA|nr:hypothetical protein Y032_0018g3633 [Ancylostoma ceylanicum]